jgi:hypothetical protein
MQLQKHLFSFRKRLQPMTPFAKKCVMAPDDICTQEHCTAHVNGTILSKITTSAAQIISTLKRRILTKSSGKNIRNFIAETKAHYALMTVYFVRAGSATLREQHVLIPAKAYIKI